ncbi:hypothetical protein ACEN4F_11155 [Ruoffia sp. FAM 20858]
MNIKGRLKKLEETLSVMDQDEKIINLVKSLEHCIKEDTDEAEELYREAVRNMKRG